MSSRHIQTLTCAYDAICRGAMPWVALGDFMNEWFDYSRDRRADLVADPLTLPADLTSELHRWATLCAASAEWLCMQAAIPYPPWIDDSRFTLPEPWFDSLQAQKPDVRERLKRTTPEPFTRRNIFCGDRIFATKYDFAAQMRRRAGHAADPDQEIVMGDPR